jgi:hypothetical protein
VFALDSGKDMEHVEAATATAPVIASKAGEDLSSLRCPELRALCKERQLLSSGKKAVLLERLGCPEELRGPADEDTPIIVSHGKESREEEPSTPDNKSTIDSGEVCDLCKGGYEPHNCFYSGPDGHSAQCSWLKAFKQHIERIERRRLELMVSPK